MPKLVFPRDFRAVSNLSFCYICGKTFLKGDETSRDHVPPKSAFNASDKEPPLILKTHNVCNHNYSVADNQVGILISLKNGQNPKSPKNKPLKFISYSQFGMTAIDNLNVDAVVWRWITAFHAALYLQPMPNNTLKAITTPFLRGEKKIDGIEIHPLLPQHLLFVETIKRNRAYKNIDQIKSNNNKLTYECVWAKYDKSEKWFCIFALDIYGWKELGSHTDEIPARGCAGAYQLYDGSVPENATKDYLGNIIIPNYDIFDPFAV